MMLKRIFLISQFTLPLVSMATPAPVNKPLCFLYTTRPGFFMRKIMCNPWLNSVAGFFADSRLSRYAIERFVESYNINVEEAAKPLADYTTLNDFFTRTLKEGARPLDAAQDALVSPADGTIIALESLRQENIFPIKTATFNLQQFLQDANLAQEYYGGTLLVIRLAPQDYHRFHFPYAGTPEKAQRIAGNYESVDPITYAMGIQPLTENERHIIKFNTDTVGQILMVPVGALCVGRIVETYTPEQKYNKGDEAGYFSFGGSTLALLFKKDTIKVNQNIINASQKGCEFPIKLGQKIATIQK